MIGACFSGIFGRMFGPSGTIKITVFCLFFSFLVSILIFYEVAFLGAPTYLILNDWVNSGSLYIKWGFIFDSLTVSLCFVVTFISVLVHIYSIEYMSHDPHLTRFMCYLSLFTFFMLILITADNLLQMFVGWEGVGLCSYLLINFWFTRIQANKAAIKAMLLNRIGDFSLILAILILFLKTKALDYATIAALVPLLKNHSFIIFNFSYNLIDLVCCLLFIGAVGKSAQIGLHTWLPDAMEGPTPVSALIHAATMVTAGVFLISRTSFIFEFSFKILDIIIFVGATTAFLASSIGLVQNDLKRVIAYSTCSQLGYMIFAAGLSIYSVSVYHLVNHAFFKALLFLAAGSIIHGINDEQDMRKMGGLKNFLPFTYISVICGSLALIGFPFLTGFYSKDLILESAFSKYTSLSFFSYTLGSIGAFFTAFYSTRLLFLTFLSKPNGFKRITCFLADSGLIIKIVLSILIIPSIFAGYFSKDLVVGLGSSFFKNSLYQNLHNFHSIDAEFIAITFKNMPVFLSLLGFFTAFLIYSFKKDFLFSFKKTFLGRKLYNFLSRKWYFDKIYNEFLGSIFFKFGYSISYKFIDKGIFETMGPTGLAIFTKNLSEKTHKSNTNYLYHWVIILYFFTTLLFQMQLLKALAFTLTYWLGYFSIYEQILNHFLSIILNSFSIEFLIVNFFVLTLNKKI